MRMEIETGGGMKSAHRLWMEMETTWWIQFYKYWIYCPVKPCETCPVDILNPFPLSAGNPDGKVLTMRHAMRPTEIKNRQNSFWATESCLFEWELFWEQAIHRATVDLLSWWHLTRSHLAPIRIGQNMTWNTNAHPVFWFGMDTGEICWLVAEILRHRASCPFHSNLWWQHPDLFGQWGTYQREREKGRWILAWRRRGAVSKLMFLFWIFGPSIPPKKICKQGMTIIH